MLPECRHMVSLSKRSYIADGTAYVEFRRKGSQELVARREGNRWFTADDTTAAEKAELEGEK